MKRIINAIIWLINVFSYFSWLNSPMGEDPYPFEKDIKYFNKKGVMK